MIGESLYSSKRKIESVFSGKRERVHIIELFYGTSDDFGSFISTDPTVHSENTTQELVCVVYLSVRNILVSTLFKSGGHSAGLPPQRRAQCRRLHHVTGLTRPKRYVRIMKTMNMTRAGQIRGAHRRQARGAAAGGG